MVSSSKEGRKQAKKEEVEMKKVAAGPEDNRSINSFLINFS